LADERVNAQRAPEASSLAQVREHFTAANELESYVEICCVLLTLNTAPTTTRVTIQCIYYRPLQWSR